MDWTRRWQLLRHQVADNRASDVGKPMVSALEAKRQLGVIDSEQVQHGGLEIMNVDRMGDDIIGEIVRLAVRETCLHPAPR